MPGSEMLKTGDF